MTDDLGWAFWTAPFLEFVEYNLYRMIIFMDI